MTDFEFERNKEGDGGGGEDRNGQDAQEGCCWRTGPLDSNSMFEDEKPRNCTDLVFLIMYIIFCCIMIFIAAFAFSMGNPLRLINGMDSFGNVCGTMNEDFNNFSYTGQDMRNKPFVFFLDLLNMETSIRICIESCPNTTITNNKELEDFYKNTFINLCRYDYEFNNTNTAKFDVLAADVFNRLCPMLPIYPSQPVLNRCIPKSGTNTGVMSRFFFNSYAYLNGLSLFKHVLGDLAITWKMVLALTTLSFVFSFFIVILMHWMTTFFGYLIIFSSLGLSLGFSIFLWYTYSSIKSSLDLTPENQVLDELVRNERAFLAYSIISSLVFVILLLIAFYLYKRVSLIAKLFRISGKVICAMPCITLQPFITYFSMTVFFLFWLLVVLCLATADYPSSRFVKSHIHSTSTNDLNGVNLDSFNNSIFPAGEAEIEEISGVTFIEYNEGVWVKYLWWVYILGLIWCSEFILACQQFIIASSVSTWYFSKDKTALKCVISLSISILIKYHIGSIAFGSLIITTLKIPRLIISFIQRTLHKWRNINCIKSIDSTCSSCLSGCDKLLKYVHHNGYTVVAIQGIPFCPSSKIAYEALMKNILQINVLNNICDALLFMAKCISAIFTGVIAMLIFQKDDNLHFYAMPLLVTIIFAYFVAHCVISMFEMVVDTLFLCFCEDINMNQNNETKNYFASDNLFKFMTEEVVDFLSPGRKFIFREREENENEKDEKNEETIPMNTFSSSSNQNEYA